MKPALPLEEAQARVLALANLMPIENVGLDDALGRILAHDIAALRTQPSANLSAMDGYAIGPDRPTDNCWTMVGESRAGAPWGESLKAGQTIRISTGAHIPNGADRVLIQENVNAQGNTIRLGAMDADSYPDVGRHIRMRGFDFAKGDALIPAGTRLGAAHIALAVSAGHGHFAVHRAPHVAILDSGDELVSNPEAAGIHQIPASNGPMLASMVLPLGCKVTRLGPVGDDADALADALANAEDVDILITTGGASVGDHDLMQPALEAWGAKLDFWRAAMKPGKPVMVATRDRANGSDRTKQVIFGLPGNPVSAFVTAFLFAIPLIRASMGASQPLPPKIMVKTRAAMPAIGKRREFARANWDGETAMSADTQDSSALAALAASNCLIDRPAHSPALDAGTMVSAYLFTNVPIA